MLYSDSAHAVLRLKINVQIIVQIFIPFLPS